jgi:hypothetical protein
MRESKMEPFVIRKMSGSLQNLTENEFDAWDCFHTLENVPRFAAKTMPVWSVADHIRLGLSFLEEQNAPAEQVLGFLLHDCFEGVSGIDIPTPLKASWPWYVEREKEFLRFVFEAHGLEFSKYDEYVKEIDSKCYQVESGYFFSLLRGNPDYWRIDSLLKNKYLLHGSYVLAKDEFLLIK